MKRGTQMQQKIKLELVLQQKKRNPTVTEKLKSLGWLIIKRIIKCFCSL